MRLPETCSPADLAEALGRSQRWILDAARDGRLPSLKVGGRVRFTQEQVDAIVASFTRDVGTADHLAPCAVSRWSRPSRAMALSRARTARTGR